MTFVPQDNVLYRITTGLDSDMVLDVSQAQNALNQIILYKWNNGANQKFAFRAVGNNKYAIFCSKNNMTVEVPEGQNKDGVQITCSQPNKKDNEFWELIPCNDAHFKGKNAFYIKSWCGKALDVCEGKAKNDQKVIQWAYNGNKNQIWVIEPVW